jgi:hypothetical protein
LEDILFNDDNKSVGNKLRTYRKLKAQFDLENYLCADVNKKSISTFVKIRISNSNLHMSRSLLLNINLNLSKSDILINEGTISQIFLKNSSQQDCNF